MLNHTPFIFVNNFLQKAKNINVLIAGGSLFYTAVHKKTASPFYTCQLSDMFAYELPSMLGRLTSNIKSPSPSSTPNKYNYLSKSDSPTVVYNFHSLTNQNRFFIFTVNSTSLIKSTFSKASNVLDSIAELFMSANWLEREISELSGVPFSGKKDLRNLMLQFGDLTAPFQKAFPSVGLKDLFYDPIKDTLTQSSVTVQT